MLLLLIVGMTKAVSSFNIVQRRSIAELIFSTRYPKMHDKATEVKVVAHTKDMSSMRYSLTSTHALTTF